MRTLVTLGHGYSAAALAASLAGWRVVGTTRSGEKAAAMRAAGVEPIDWVDRAEVDRAIATADALLASLPPGAEGDPVLARHADALAGVRVEWVGYLSTTGVYGDRRGGWADEESAFEPSGERGRRRVAAEAAWTATGLPVHLFRLAGIYGPGRSVLDRLRAGRVQRVIKPGQVFSRIHVADIAQVLAASLARPNPGRAYNVADDMPAPPDEVIVYACGLLGIAVPPPVPFAEAELSPMAASFWAESKRIANRRIKAELAVSLAYPDYRAGLAAIFVAGG
jgi:nucleoside-diphosphate-sugar epimerase